MARDFRTEIPVRYRFLNNRLALALLLGLAAQASDALSQ